MSLAQGSFSFQPNNDAEFRTWVGNVSALLTASGLVKTSDTGQIAIPFAGARPTNPASAGYEIWRFADAQQANLPIYIKLEYSIGTAGTNAPMFYLTIGTGTDGAGTITGTLMTRQQCARGSAAPSALGFDAGVAYGEGYLAVCFGFGANNSSELYFLISRSLGVDGTPDDRAVYAFFSQFSNHVHQTSCKPPGPQAQRISNTSGVGMPVLFTPENANGSEIVSLAGDTPVYPIEPFLGKRQPPLLVGVVVHANDVGAGVVFTTTMYGASRKFRRMGYPNACVVRGTSSGGSSYPCLCARWE